MKLDNKKIAILATDGFEHSELFEPLRVLENHGADVDIVSLKDGEIKSWKDKNWGEAVIVDALVADVSPEDYDGLVLPGGVINPDSLRKDKAAVDFVRGFFKNGTTKPVAAICHGPWMLVEADVVQGRTVTSYESIKTDLVNAGADWLDKEVVVDKGLVTSRSPKDLPSFTKKMVEEFAEGVHQRRHAEIQMGMQ